MTDFAILQTEASDVPIDPLAITLSDELKEIEVPAKRAKSPDLPRESFECTALQVDHSHWVSGAH